MRVSAAEVSSLSLPRRDAMLRERIVFVLAGIILSSGSLDGPSPLIAGAQGISPSRAPSDLLLVLGEGVVGDPTAASSLRNCICTASSAAARGRTRKASRQSNTGISIPRMCAKFSSASAWRRTTKSSS